ncbi:TonB-dependent hemoglobin/transferrin/lactoferrin family receptor [Moritella viscosa]|nr:TonB-dependent hemoglobin/transferrin/lactoferrin family receptor [Moritella viscosa]CED60655.1 TonB-dependent heme receptor [Moritella viscosa]SGZ01549.1 Hypothetical heme receptor [Moritella viscosa]SGZ08456.1 Hypothetical heme receptor [Moritella viscosa]SGZ10718.1 Hypothetical heme receptor [Moritella viscosa]SGZ16507.1 Hypothetical heme receptor [Moritella viscosa]
MGKKYLALTIYIALFSSNVMSQDINKTISTIDDIKLDNKNQIKTIGKTVIVASRSALPPSDIAGSVAVISADELKKQMTSNLEDSFKYIPSVTMNSNPRFGAMNFNVRGIEGNRIKVLIDGVEQPVTYASGGRGETNVLGKGQGQVEIDNLTAIEINKGASSSLYGSGALGGSVLMMTKTPDNLLDGQNGHLSVDVGYQSKDESYKQTINAAAEINKNLKAMVILTHRNGNELKTHNSGDDVNGEKRGEADPLNYTSDNILSKLELQASKNNHLTFTGLYFKKKTDGKVLSLEDVSKGFNKYSNYHYEDMQKQARIGVKHIWTANNTVFDSLDWQVNWQTSEAINTTNDTLTKVFPPFTNTDRTRQRNAKDTSLQLEVQFNKAFSLGSSNNDLIYGSTIVDRKFTMETSDIESSGKNTSGVVEMPPKTHLQKMGLFAQNQAYLFDDKLIVTTGIRYDQYQYSPTKDDRKIVGNLGEYNNFKDDAFTGQFSLLYHFTDSLSGYAKYAHSFKAPTPEELYYSFERNPIPSMNVIVQANPELKSETSDSIDIGIRQSNHLLDWELSGYYNDYSDFINTSTWMTFKRGTRSMFSKNENLDSVRIYGAELSSTLQIGNITPLPMGTYLRFAGAWSKGEDKNTKKSIDTIAPLTGVLGMGYDNAAGSFGLETTIIAMAAKRGNDWSDKKNLSVAGYGVLDLTMYAKPIKNLTIRGGVFNLLNKKYLNYSKVKGLTKSSISNVDSISEPSINFGINTKYIF